MVDLKPTASAGGYRHSHWVLWLTGAVLLAVWLMSLPVWFWISLQWIGPATGACPRAIPDSGVTNLEDFCQDKSGGMWIVLLATGALWLAIAIPLAMVQRWVRGPHPQP